MNDKYPKLFQKLVEFVFWKAYDYMNNTKQGRADILEAVQNDQYDSLNEWAYEHVAESRY